MARIRYLAVLIVAGTALGFPYGAWAEGRQELRLHTAPNPFKAGYTDARIIYAMPEAGTVTITVYDRDGNPVRTVGEELRRVKGPHTSDDRWDGRDKNGNLVAPGLYVVVLEAKIGGDIWRDTFNCVVER